MKRERELLVFNSGRGTGLITSSRRRRHRSTLRHLELPDHDDEEMLASCDGEHEERDERTGQLHNIMPEIPLGSDDDEDVLKQLKKRNRIKSGSVRGMPQLEAPGWE